MIMYLANGFYFINERAGIFLLPNFLINLAQTFHKIWIHLIWTTHNRQQLLIPNVPIQLRGFVKNVAEEKGYHYDIMNGVADHVHCLFSINPKHAISDVAKNIKGKSSHWINENKLIVEHFKWQDGFGAFSVSDQHVAVIRRYIYDQERHHQRVSFEDELNILQNGRVEQLYSN